MAPDVIDLISSSPASPPTSHQPRSRTSTAPPAPTKTSNNPRVFERLAPVETPREEAEVSIVASSSWLSDDWDNANDIDALIPTDERASKRRRTSPQPQDDIGSSPPVAAKGIRASISDIPQPPLLNAPGGRHPRAIVDPIEFTSSIEASGPAIRSDCTPLISSRAVTKTSTALLLSSDFDPFASSPRQVAPRPADKSCPKLADFELSDPFASSPRLAVNTTSRPSVSHSAIVAAHSPSKKPPSPRRQWGFDLIPSSAPEASSFGFSPFPGEAKENSAVINIGDSDPPNDLGDEDKDEDDLPDIADVGLAKYKSRPRSPLRRSRSEIVTSKSRLKSSTAPNKKSALQVEGDREAKFAAKEAEKEKKRQEREQNKETKAREKHRAAALAEVNKIRTDKKVSTPEMIVDLPASLSPELKIQVETLLEGLDVQYTDYDSPVENAIKWRRKVRSRFDDDMGRWEPTPLRIEEENDVLVILTADEFVNLALSYELDSHSAKMAQHFAGHHIIYLLQGMMPWMKTNRNIRNRQFTSGVRSQEASAQPNASRGGRRRNNGPSAEYVSEDVVEDAMLNLQVHHDVLIHHTTVTLETAQWITAFTQHISTKPYKKQRDEATSAAGFCMESGQVRTGDDASDTFVRMLQEIVRVTAPIAYGVAAEFDTVTKLVDGLEAGGHGRLEGLRKSANKDGVFSDRTVGQAVSRRMFKVFTGRDEASTDV